MRRSAATVGGSLRTVFELGSAALVGGSLETVLKLGSAATVGGSLRTVFGSVGGSLSTRIIVTMGGVQRTVFGSVATVGGSLRTLLGSSCNSGWIAWDCSRVSCKQWENH